jgi:hypothetical protein
MSGCRQTELVPIRKSSPALVRVGIHSANQRPRHNLTHSIALCLRIHRDNRILSTTITRIENKDDEVNVDNAETRG